MYNHNPEVIGFMALLIVILFAFLGFLAWNRGRSISGALLLGVCMTPFIAIGLVLLIGPDYVALYKRKKKDKEDNWIVNPQV
jgi:hypothetical protein